jgi:hypothetical protein
MIAYDLDFENTKKFQNEYKEFIDFTINGEAVVYYDSNDFKHCAKCAHGSRVVKAKILPLNDFVFCDDCGCFIQ